MKGEKKKSKKDKKDKKRKHEESIQDEVRQKFREDRNLHGGWWKSSTVTEITGPVAIEFGEHSYIKVHKYTVWKLRIFLPLRFYVKSNLALSEAQKMQF